jgi:hypothetical protein
MSIDLDDIESRINNGIYGDDRMTNTGRDDAFAALAALVAEVERLREMLLNAGWPRESDELAAMALRYERAAVVAALRRFEPGPMGLSLVDMASVANDIERGEHRREET